MSAQVAQNNNVTFQPMVSGISSQNQHTINELSKTWQRTLITGSVMAIVAMIALAVFPILGIILFAISGALLLTSMSTGIAMCELKKNGCPKQITQDSI